ncbi:helix-turn-helix domain-containing protein [Derxia lacustris]|uniref:helix-turn-helix domain-containing protein n=1 Tax=Derxia lacustris TaxID=764842 RepID=UPI000A176BA7|nr:helix-turn-helix transcriptional regulator [Derxia lacustris]
MNQVLNTARVEQAQADAQLAHASGLAPLLPASVGESFGLVVRRLREARGWSQEALANRAELNRSYMGEIERATVMPSLATASKLAVALGLPLSELIAQCEVRIASARRL